MKLLSVPLILCLGVYPLLAQTRAVINGTVTDPSGATVGDAKVQLTAPATGLRREMGTHSNGIYEFPSLPVGTYNISVFKSGLETYSLTGVDVVIGQVRTLDVKLALGQAAQAVDVTASSELLNRSNAEIDGVIE
ncbi:MAG TPA: carboxypeptidase-like regulatory domain-containing protein, partial [Edaphobacter sp.]|nr:carboxypeptidase-like regulatory domain-containing protein [Edaphobacter sp.]